MTTDPGDAKTPGPSGSTHGPTGVATSPPGECSGWPRALAAFGTWTLLVLSLPGMGRPGGFGHLAFVALVPWALCISRPGRRAFRIEWVATMLGMIPAVYWLGYVVPAAAVLIPFVGAFYMCSAGVLLRRLALRWPLAVAVPAAWTAGELVRGWVPAPAAFLHHRLGHMAHDTLWMVGSARVAGYLGLTWVFAAFAGMLADLWRERQGTGSFARGPVLVFGLGPLVLSILATFLVKAPATEEGPSVLMIQPGIEQEVKNFTQDPLRDIFGGAIDLTAQALAELPEPPDLVLWGESMVPNRVPAEGLEEAILAGAERPAWTGSTLELGEARFRRFQVDTLVPGVMFGREPIEGALRELAQIQSASVLSTPWFQRALAGEALIPEGTSFAGGAEELVLHEGEIRRRNSYFVWDAEGNRSEGAAKLEPVPGGETLMGAHRIPGVLAMMQRIGGYIPDFIGGEESAVLGFQGRDGRSWRFGVAICYDNIFDDPFLVPVRREPVDFTVVASNEAWYRTSHEMNHMVAMSRVAAVISGRSIVRATNSGISIVIDPDGSTVAVLEVEGRRKMVQGTLAARVPVPVRDAEGRAPIPFYARFEDWVQALFVAGIALLAFTRAPFRGESPSRQVPA